MLPEKKKRLIWGIIAIVLTIIVVFLIAKLSNFIKSRSNTELTRANDAYPTYSYYGFVKDDYNVYKLYGINDTETNLELKTFYDIQDLSIKNKKIVVYTDALNEVRYDSKNKEFYFYELNPFYSNKLNIKMSDNYLLDVSGEVTYWPIDQDNENKKTITSDVTSYIISNDIFYYTKDSNLVKFDLETGNALVLTNLTENTKINDINNNLILLEDEKNVYVYNLETNIILNINEIARETSIKYLSKSKKGFIYIADSILKEYDQGTKQSNVLKNNFLEDIVLCKYLKDNVYFMKTKEDSFIYNLSTFEKQTLENDYVEIEVIE